MQMVDGLTAVCAGIHHQAVTLFQVLRAGYLAGCGEQIAEQAGIGRQCMGVRSYVSLGNDKDVHRSLRMQVGKGEGIRRLMQAIGGQNPQDDLAEDAIGGGRVSHASMLREGVCPAACRFAPLQIMEPSGPA